MLITEYRLELVIQALRAILPLAHPADTTLRYFFKNERIGSNERELVAEAVFGVLRHRLLLEQAFAGNLTSRATLLETKADCGSVSEADFPAPDASQHRVKAASPRRMALAWLIRFGD